jgi:hypothetical protein
MERNAKRHTILRQMHFSFGAGPLVLVTKYFGRFFPVEGGTKFFLAVSAMQ